MQASAAQSCIFGNLMEKLMVIRDPRVKNRCDHLLVDVMIIGVCSVLCGAESWDEIGEFAKHREDWFKQFLELPNGIPSHDTIARVFSIIDIVDFERIFTEWATSLAPAERLKRFSMDGKTVKGTYGNFNDGTRPLHLVSIFSTESGLVLGQSSAPSSGMGESEAALKCLELVDIKDALVSVDAGLSTKRISNAVIEKGGDYIFPIKRNCREAFAEVEDFPWGKRSDVIDKASTKEMSHGRQEERVCLSVPAAHFSASLNASWNEIKTVMRITRTRKTKDNRYYIQSKDEDGNISYKKNLGEWKITKEVTYYISSAELPAASAIMEIRDHWSIENKLHWVLDVSFKEDQWRVRAKKAAQTLALVRKFAFNILAKNKDKGSKKIKMKKASWDPAYLEKLLAGI